MIEVIDIKEILSKLDIVGKKVGNTPILSLSKAFYKPGVRIQAKLEWHQIGGSVKARPAFKIIREAILQGLLDPSLELLDASSGNTAIAYAAIGKELSIPVTICIPENASEERIRVLKELGARLILTSKFGTTDEAQDIAYDLNYSNPGKYYYADQYNNSNNWKAHYESTGWEIWNQTSGQITHFVTGLGTTGSFIGIGRRLKELNPEIKIISLQPETALHGLEGWKHIPSAKIPGIYDHQLADRNIEISTEESYYWIRRLAEKEGILLSPSAAANYAGTTKVAEEIKEGTIVTLFPDDAKRYNEVMKSFI